MAASIMKIVLALICSLLLPPSTEALSTPSSRRSFVATSIGWGCLGGVPSIAHAVKARNEALCGTGFYTNIWQYKCTDIGDIADEGEAKNLSSKEQGATESLMSKLNLGDVEVVLDEEAPKQTSASADDANRKEQ